MWMIVFWVLPLVAIVYLAWHIWMILPFSGWWKTAIIVLGVCSFLLLFLSVARKFDTLPLSLAQWSYEIGTSSIMVMLYLVMLFLVLDLGRLMHLVPRSLVYHNWQSALPTSIWAIITLVRNLHAGWI